jgi:hypothetical protein
MTIRFRYKVSLSASSTSNEERDLGNATYEVVSDSSGKGGAVKVIIPKNTTNQQVPLSGISAPSLLAVRTNALDPSLPPVNLDMRKNSTGGEVTTIAPFGAKEGLYMVTVTGLTALYFTNSSTTTDMEVTIFIAGD